jgi:hypothetical protein
MMGDGKKLERLSKVRPTRNENGVSVDEVGMEYQVAGFTRPIMSNELLIDLRI